MAAQLARAGWATAGIGYTLAPEVRLSAIVAEIAEALLFLHREAPRLGLDPARLVLGGHSAGGHLAATMLAGSGGPEASAALAGVVAVSGVFDLAPVAASYVNDRVGLDEAEVIALSPLYADPVRDVPMHLVVGADEPEAFRLHTAALAQYWAPRLPRLTVREAPGRDHFDVLDELADPASPSFAALLAMGEPR
jgi:arylformamidase